MQKFGYSGCVVKDHLEVSKTSKNLEERMTPDVTPCDDNTLSKRGVYGK